MKCFWIGWFCEMALILAKFYEASNISLMFVAK
jgi:hypothetical protein